MKRSDRHSGPVLLFLFLLKSLTSPVVSAALASVASISHSALHTGLWILPPWELELLATFPIPLS